MEIDIKASAVITLTVTALVLLALPVAAVIFWKKRCGKSVSLMPLIFGAVGFIASALVLEQLVHTVCLVLDNPVSRFISGNTAAYVIYGAMMAGIFEECGRFVVMKFIMKKNKTRENAVMYGIGHGGIEVLAVGVMSVVNMLIVLAVIGVLGIDKALPLMNVPSDAPESTLQAAYAAIASAADFSPFQGAITVFERIIAMAIHISLTVTVYCGVMRGKIGYLFFAIFAHAAVDVFAALYQRGVIGIVTAELCMLAGAAVLTICGVRLYKGLKGEVQTEKQPL
ncbi:MAG: YhfC family intramembrane metalloprotease [Firmicutes bacterium]|nr:YhfC family intramembrane metalloprotease [[Eubacterium] siraeum]MCM1486760.1 YhfC family intramembrane metalloprotease [Bacillota bacterium]